jgi:hypothetical protein
MSRAAHSAAVVVSEDGVRWWVQRVNEMEREPSRGRDRGGLCLQDTPCRHRQPLHCHRSPTHPEGRPGPLRWTTCIAARRGVVGTTSHHSTTQHSTAQHNQDKSTTRSTTTLGVLGAVGETVAVGEHCARGVAEPHHESEDTPLLYLHNAPDERHAVRSSHHDGNRVGCSTHATVHGHTAQHAMTQRTATQHRLQQ